jgi:hypothetical protein
MPTTIHLDLSGINTGQCDGVVIGYAFWFISLRPVTNYEGRTASHSRSLDCKLHVTFWGDGCTVDDFCADTPSRRKENELPTGSILAQTVQD